MNAHAFVFGAGRAEQQPGAAALPPKKTASLAWGSIPIRENLVRFGYLILRTGEIEFQFSGLARNLNYDGVETIPLHACVELFLGFARSVFLKAVTHDGESARGVGKAM